MAKAAEKTKKPAGGAEKGRLKHRSPNYPSMDLEKALERTKKLHDQDKTHKVPIGIVHERWGYKKHSAAGNQAVAAVKSYGLVAVEGAGESRLIAVSEAGRRIILNLDPQDRSQLLKQAAVGPSLFSYLWSKYRESGIPSDDVLKHHLVFERNFNEDFVDDAIARFRRTVAYSELTAADKIEVGGTEDDGDEPEFTRSGGGDTYPPPPPSPKGRRQMQIGQIEEVCVLDEGTAVIQLPEKMSKVSAQDLEEWLLTLIRKAKRRANAEDQTNGE